MDTAGSLPPQSKTQDDEAIADSMIEQVLHHTRVFTHAAPFTAITLCFLAGVGAATVWNATHR